MASLLSYALTDLASVKESLQIPSGVTKYDNLIIRKINQATLAIENYCSRRFKSTAYAAEEYSATQIDQMVLKQRPVVSFDSLEIRDSGLNENNWETIDSQLYFVDNESGVLDLMFSANGRWKRYRASYTAGYASIPNDLAEACASLACFYFNNSDSSNVGVQEKAEGQRKVRFLNTTQSFNSIIKTLGIDEVINHYANNPLMSNR